MHACRSPSPRAVISVLKNSCHTKCLFFINSMHACMHVLKCAHATQRLTCIYMYLMCMEICVCLQAHTIISSLSALFCFWNYRQTHSAHKLTYAYTYTHHILPNKFLRTSGSSHTWSIFITLYYFVSPQKQSLCIHTHTHTHTYTRTHTSCLRSNTHTHTRSHFSPLCLLTLDLTGGVAECRTR